jgi:Zn-dependent protease with chaperone function
MPLFVEVAAVVLAHAIGAWLFTYLLHSTVMISLARLLERLRNEPALRAAVWRAAIIGPLFTASLHTALPFGSPFRLSSEPAGVVLGPRPALSLLIIVCWCALIAVRVISIVRAEMRGRAAIGARHSSTNAQHLGMVAACARAAGLRRVPRLTTSQRTFSPAALVPYEICVPHGIFDDLSESEQNALFAHEVAHHARRDPLWCGAASAIAAVCFFQPLNGLAARRLKLASEQAADAQAISDTRDPLALARALTALAPYALRGAQMRTAATGSPLVERIRRMLAHTAPQPQRHSRWLAAAHVLTIVGVCLALGPGVNFRPDNAANSIPSLTPSRAEPTAQMLEIRQFDRKMRAVQHRVERRAITAIRR